MYPHAMYIYIYVASFVYIHIYLYVYVYGSLRKKGARGGMFVSGHASGAMLRSTSGPRS